MQEPPPPEAAAGEVEREAGVHGAVAQGGGDVQLGGVGGAELGFDVCGEGFFCGGGRL